MSLIGDLKCDISSLIKGFLVATAARWLPSDVRCLTIELSVDSVRSSMVVLRLNVIPVSFLICLRSEHTSPTDGLTEVFVSLTRALTAFARVVTVLTSQ
jgi:hypothetical protein